MIERLGLRRGEPVRFRRADRARWQDGVVVGLERDGSLGVRDEKGAWRAVPFAQVLVRRRAGRGRAGWEPLLDRAGRAEQLALFDSLSDQGARPPGRRPARRRAPRSGGASPC